MYTFALLNLTTMFRCVTGHQVNKAEKKGYKNDELRGKRVKDTNG